MHLPDYLIPPPAFALDTHIQRACDDLLTNAIAQGHHTPLCYTLPIPKWQFLCYLADHHGLALHGSGDAHVVEFEPRQPTDVTTFGSQRAVYAAADGLWPMYFAIVDRTQHIRSLLNACVRVSFGEEQVSDPLYLLSVSQQALAHQPWRSGWVYILPRTSFMQEPPFIVQHVHVQSAQLASAVAVTPLAKLAITPADFPLLASIRGHDDERLADYVAAFQAGAPWPD